MVFSPPSWCIMSHFDFHNHPEDSDELAHWATSCGHFDEVDSGYTVTITDLQKIARKSFQLTFKCLLSRLFGNGICRLGFQNIRILQMQDFELFFIFF